MKNNIIALSSLFLILTSNLAFAQYTQSDSALVRTTFLREFDKDIIYDYLTSKDSNKINAALLSISHSEDTTFIDSIIKLNYYKYGDYISFALGQLGESKKSEEYLFHILDSIYVPFKSYALDAISQIGDSLTLNRLFVEIDDTTTDSKYFPASIVNFHSRGIKKESTILYLSKILNSNLDEEKLFNTLFALYRLGSSKQIIPTLKDILFGNNDETIKIYALNNFRKLKFFPDDDELFRKLIASESWKIRTETANSVCYYPFTTKDEVSTYLTLLDDVNPNVSRTAATAIKNIRFSNDRKFLKIQIENYLKNDNHTSNTKGELLISYASLFNLKVEEVIDEYEDFVEQKFIYKLLAANTSDWEFNYNYLSDNLEESNEIELLNLLPAYLALQNKFINDEEYAADLFLVFQSDKPSSASIIADGLKLPMIHHYREIMQELVVDQIFRNKNNPQFAETIISLANLSYKIDRVFYDSVIDMLSTSQLYSIKKYVFEKQELEFTNSKQDTLFTSLWSSAYKYRFAEIETNKGKFKIELIPSIAPMTCGNFISLTEKGFYDDITFHRVVPDFVIQTGDITGTGWGGPGYEIVSEFSPLPFQRSAVGIASNGKDTEGSQWFVMHSNFPHLNGRYTNWATVVSGMDIVDNIDEGDKIISITLED